MSDYIRLPRSALSDDNLLNDADMCHLYLNLIARSDDSGCIVISIRRLANEIGTSYQRLRTLLGRLESTQKLTQGSTQKLTQITLCGTNQKVRKLTQKPTQESTQQSTQKKTAKFTPPTKEEAQAYIVEKGFHWGDADLFIDFYEQRGWNLSNGQPMVDWKAAMRNWENRWKRKYGTNTQTKYDPRRGADAGYHSESDYGGTF